MTVKKVRLRGDLVRLVVTGCAAAILTAMLVCAAAALLITSGAIGEESSAWCSIAALFLGAAAGGVYASGKRGEKFIVTALLTGGLFALVRLLCSLSGDGACADVSMLEGLIAILAGSIIGGLPKKQKRGRKK